MKTLLIFALYLISGPVSCFDVIGYSEGSIIINCRHKQYGGSPEYFCKKGAQQCVYVDQTQNTWRSKDTVYLHSIPRSTAVIYRNLSVQDAGSYQCGKTGVWNHDLNLTVIKNLCCRSKTVTGYQGETLTISCSYPEQYNIHVKTFLKQAGRYFTELIDTADSPKGRFSISDNTGSKVVSVRISDVREEDGGVYYCGAWYGEESISYESLYSEIQLQVTAPTAPTSTPSDEDPSTPVATTAPTSTPPDEDPSSSTVIISVCVCAVLLLIGGSALIFYRLVRLKKHQVTDSDPSSRTQLKDLNQVPPVVNNSEETKHGRRDSAFGVYANASPPAANSDKHIYTSVQSPKDQDPTYTTVSFQRSPASPPDTSASLSMEVPATEYATLRHQPHLE